MAHSASVAGQGAKSVSRRATTWIMLIYFASGACSLMDEVVWARLLKLTLGNTVYANTVVVSVFMGGLALGALIMSRYADRVRRRLRLYAILETLVTISALALPAALRGMDHLYTWFYRTYDPSNAVLLALQVVVSAILLLIPTMLMGSTLPLLGRFVTSLEKDAGHLVGRLYALNTLGAAAGCFVAGFVLIRTVGVMGTLYCAAALNVLVALGGWLLSRDADHGQADAATEAATEAAVPDVAAEMPSATSGAARDRRFPLLVGAFFMSGLASIGFELVWMRSVVHLLGGVTYVFSAVLTVYLLGNVIGAAIGSRIVPRLKNPAMGLAITLFTLGLCGLLFLPALLVWTSRILPNVDRVLVPVYAALSIPELVARPFVQSFLLFIVPSTIMGLGFPIALQAWANHLHQVGQSTGRAYAANTIGAVTGGVLTGFVLLPGLNLQMSISLLGLATLWAGAVLAMQFTGGRGLVPRFGLVVAAVALSIGTALGPRDLFSRVIENGLFVGNMELLAVEEGLTTTVSLHRDRQDQSLHLYSSGQSLAGDSYEEQSDQKMQGHFAALLNRQAKRVLSVGFGSGETTACLAMHDLERIDCVEIAREIVKVAMTHFRHINLGDRLDDEINMIYMDAKNYLHLTDERYDAIVNDSIHPRDFADNASLHTREYFEDAKALLNENGLISTWLPTYRMSTEVFESVLRTEMEVYPHVTLWYLTPHPAPLVLVIASNEQQYYSPRHVETELTGAVLESLAPLNVNTAMDVLSCYVADENDLRPLLERSTVNSDYRPFIEFSSDEVAPPEDLLRKFVYELSRESVYDHIDWTGFTDAERELWLAEYRQVHRASDHLLAAYDSRDAMGKYESTLAGLRVQPRNPGLLDYKTGVEGLLYDQATSLVRAGRVDQAVAFSDHLFRMDANSSAGWLIRSSVSQLQGDGSSALDAARRAVVANPANAQAHSRLGFLLLGMKQREEAIAALRKSLELDGQQIGALSALADVLIWNRETPYHDPAEAARLAKRACDLTGRTNLTTLETWMRASALAGRDADARTAARHLRDLDPPAELRVRIDEVLRRTSNRS